MRSRPFSLGPAFSWLLKLPRSLVDNRTMPSARYSETYTLRQAVSEVCYLFRDRSLEELLRRDLEWRTVRRQVLGTDFLGTGWRGRAYGKAMRLTRRGFEFKERGQVRSYTWLDMQDVVQSDRGYKPWLL